ncbi:hypothetical protein BXZ70DRAFT_938064 [Cristinia sonorae]|uniref:Uncharacterized protein n=1 Tax=Cristinia sonorae TaxID=1940300 RepID=A0A8K0UPD8_9AGAR|nr:hypothetical protein BXZ70DRAFT_938064 [Cristinia sonorae]
MSTDNDVLVVIPSQPSRSLDHEVDPINGYDVSNAVRDLLELSLEDVELNETSHTIIHRASTLIFNFLDKLIDHGVTCVVCDEELLAGFSALLHLPVLNKLFAYRHLFLRIASGESGGDNIVACWVDVLLAKIGSTVLAIVGESQTQDMTRFELRTLLSHVSESSLRASSQLPKTFAAIPSMIGSSQSSPAAIRLAVQLTYATYVLGPQLTKNASWPSDGLDPDEMLQFLLAYIHARNSESDDIQSAQSQYLHAERTTYAMVVSLFAVSDTAAVEVQRIFRPHTLATLLHFIHLILRTSHSDNPPVVQPMNVIDCAERVLLSSDITLAWSWSSWDERRTAYTEDMDFMTSNWLYHLGRCPHNEFVLHDWEESLILSMRRDPTVACANFVRLLQHANKHPTWKTDERQLVNIHKASWGISSYLQASSRVNNFPVSKDIINVFVRSFLEVGNSSARPATRDIMLQGLSYVEKAVLRKVFEEVHKSHNALKLDGEFASLKHAFDSGPSAISVTLKNRVMARHLLQFLTLAWSTGFCGFVSSISIVAFIKTLVNWICSGHNTHGLLESLMSARASFAALVYEKGQEDAPLKNEIWQDDQLLQVTLSNPRLTADPYTLFALTGHLSSVAMHQTCKPVTILVAWDLLRGKLSLALQDRLPGLDRELSEMVSFLLASTLHSILVHSGSETLLCISCSPWTRSLRTTLKSWVDRVTAHQQPALVERIKSLLNKIDTSCDPVVMSTGDVSLTTKFDCSPTVHFCSIAGYPHIMTLLY